jgi:hypothetical protein
MRVNAGSFMMVSLLHAWCRDEPASAGTLQADRSGHRATGDRRLQMFGRPQTVSLKFQLNIAFPATGRRAIVEARRRKARALRRSQERSTIRAERHLPVTPPH